MVVCVQRMLAYPLHLRHWLDDPQSLPQSAWLDQRDREAVAAELSKPQSPGAARRMRSIVALMAKSSPSSSTTECTSPKSAARAASMLAPVMPKARTAPGPILPKRNGAITAGMRPKRTSVRAKRAKARRTPNHTRPPNQHRLRTPPPARVQ